MLAKVKGSAIQSQIGARTILPDHQRTQAFTSAEQYQQLSQEVVRQGASRWCYHKVATGYWPAAYNECMLQTALKVCSSLLCSLGAELHVCGSSPCLRPKLLWHDPRVCVPEVQCLMCTCESCCAYL